MKTILPRDSDGAFSNRSNGLYRFGFSMGAGNLAWDDVRGSPSPLSPPAIAANAVTTPMIASTVSRTGRIAPGCHCYCRPSPACRTGDTGHTLRGQSRRICPASPRWGATAIGDRSTRPLWTREAVQLADIERHTDRRIFEPDGWAVNLSHRLISPTAIVIW